MTAEPPAPLKLRASDADDIAVVSAQLQDAIIPMSDMRFLLGTACSCSWPTGSCGPANRPCRPVTRCIGGPIAACGCTMSTGCARRGLEMGDRGRMLELLSISRDGDNLTLIFAGGAEIQLLGEGLMLVLEDLDDPWPTRRAPSHRLEDT